MRVKDLVNLLMTVQDQEKEVFVYDTGEGIRTTVENVDEMNDFVDINVLLT